MRWLKHAFAIDPPGPAQPNKRQRAVADRVCRAVVRRRMSTPALLFLETVRPLCYLGAQTMHFFTPFVSVLTDPQDYQEFAGFLEQRGSVDYLCRQIRQLEREAGEGAAPAEPPEEDDEQR